MFHPQTISKLYTNVLYEDIFLNRISERQIKHGICKMGKEYSKDCANFNSDSRDFPNFNDPAFRCAYLHKYAPLHTFIVFEVMFQIFNQKRANFLSLMQNGQFKLCSLGGGPGSDAIGVLAAFRAVFNSFNLSVTIIDCMVDWKSTFSAVIQELRYGEYGEIWRNFTNLDWKYIGADLLQNMSSEVNRAIGSADFVTMVKFVSAASCTNAEQMLEKIFRIMKARSLVLYIDNAGGDFTKVFDRASERSRFKTIFSRDHVDYQEGDFMNDEFGHTSCYRATVSIRLIMKRKKNEFLQYPSTSSSVSNPYNISSMQNDRIPNNYSNTRSIRPSSTDTQYDTFIREFVYDIESRTPSRIQNVMQWNMFNTRSTINSNTQCRGISNKSSNARPTSSTQNTLPSNSTSSRSSNVTSDHRRQSAVLRNYNFTDLLIPIVIMTGLAIIIGFGGKIFLFFLTGYIMGLISRL